VNHTFGLRNHQRSSALDLRILQRMCRYFLGVLLPKKALQIDVHFVDQAEITRLNETFLRHKGATDVITFDYREPDSFAPICGEVFVCVEQAVAQARRFHTTWQSELARYIIHGVLHLAGFDDVRVIERRKMKREEDRLLRSVAGRFSLTKVGRIRQKRAKQRNNKVSEPP